MDLIVSVKTSEEAQAINHVAALTHQVTVLTNKWDHAVLDPKVPATAGVDLVASIKTKEEVPAVSVKTSEEAQAINVAALTHQVTVLTNKWDHAV